jgi:hypothetical protein
MIINQGCSLNYAICHGCHNPTPEQFHINYDDNNTYISLSERERENKTTKYMLLERLQLTGNIQEQLHIYIYILDCIVFTTPSSKANSNI